MKPSSTLLLATGCGLALLGWRSATKRVESIEARYAALLNAAWLYEDAVELAGRCAWHASNVAALSTPVHLIGTDHVEAYARGYAAEQDDDDARAQRWNKGVRS